MTRIFISLWLAITCLLFMSITGRKENLLETVNELVDEETKDNLELRMDMNLLASIGLTPKVILILCCTIPVLHLYSLYIVISSRIKKLLGKTENK